MSEQRFVRRDLEQLRKQARELLRDLRNGDPEALGRLSAQFPDRATTPQLAHALAVIARENGFLSWPKLKAAVEQSSTVVAQPALRSQPLSAAPVRRRSRRTSDGFDPLDWSHSLQNPALELRRRGGKGPGKLPSRQSMEELYAYTLRLVALGDPAEFALWPGPSGAYGKTISRLLRALLVERGALEPVRQLVLRGLQHPNARVRYECGHALDWLGDDRCVPALLELLRDPVPRVRAIALHALSCDECKLTPLRRRPEFMQLATDWAAHDPSRRVRRDAAWLLMQAADRARPPGKA
jgi:HEAT repeats